MTLRPCDSVQFRFLGAASLLLAHSSFALLGQTQAEKAIGALEAAELSRETNLAGYTVTEHYSMKSLRLNSSAEMTVATVYRKDQGKSYRVVSRSGSSLLQSKVFDRLLREEAEMSRGAARQQALINPQNYVIAFAGEADNDGRRCYVLDLTPRRASPHLLKGRAWIDEEDGTLMRVEGKTSASASFLAGRPTIIREYQKAGPFSMAKKSRAESSSFFFGKTELQIDYSDYRIEGGSGFHN